MNAVDAYIQGFPMDQELPVALIEKIIAFRIRENREKAEMKKSKSTK